MYIEAEQRDGAYGTQEFVVSFDNSLPGFTFYFSHWVSENFYHRHWEFQTLTDLLTFVQTFLEQQWLGYRHTDVFSDEGLSLIN